MSNLQDLAVVHRAGQAAALLNPTRMALMGRLSRPSSASALARQLGLPRQRVNYHLRELEKQGLVQLVEERRRGNCVERVVRATARSYAIGPEALGGLGGTEVEEQDPSSAGGLIALAARTLGEVAALRSRAEAAGKRVATLGLRADIRFPSAALRNAFAEELAREVERLRVKYHDGAAAEGRLFRLVVGAYPAPARPETGAEGTVSSPSR